MSAAARASCSHVQRREWRKVDARDLLALVEKPAGILSEPLRVTSGSVNALSGLVDRQNFIQMAAPIQPGNSGGPVIDSAGFVVGVTTATPSERAYQRAQNVNFALPAIADIAFLAGYGIAHLQAEGLTQDVVSSNVSDHVEAAAEATIMIRCLGAAPQPEPTQEPTHPHPSAMIVEHGFYVIGFDYSVLRDSSLAQCRSTCEADRRCRAFTLNQRHGICFLKEDAALQMRDDDALGGYDRSLAAEELHSGFRVQSGVDSPGGDYARVRDSDFIPCFLDCAADRRRRAFAYVRATRDCWLKDRVGRITPMSGVEFGLR